MPGSDGLRIWVFWKTPQLETRGQIENQRQQRALDPQWPTVEQPSQDEKEVLLGQYSSLSPTSTLSRIKCERYISIKKCVRSFLEVCHYCWLCYRLYLSMHTCIFVYVCGYTTDEPTDVVVKIATVLILRVYKLKHNDLSSNPGRGCLHFTSL